MKKLDNEEKSEYLIFVNSHQDSVRNKDFIFILRSFNTEQAAKKNI